MKQQKWEKILATEYGRCRVCDHDHLMEWEWASHYILDHFSTMTESPEVRQAVVAAIGASEDHGFRRAEDFHFGIED